LNKDKIIKVGSIYQKYFSNICVESKSKEDLLRIENAKDAINSGLKNFVAYSANITEITPNKLQLRWGELGLVRVWEEENDFFWCKNKRKATFSIGTGIEVNYFDDPIFGQLTQYIVVVYADVTARRKGIPCIWYKYNTNIIWNDFHAEYDINKSGNISHVVWTHPNEEKFTKSIYRVNDIYVYYDIRDEYCDIQWKDIITNATTRGIWDKWINVDWHN